MKRLILILVLFASIGACAAETITPNSSIVISCSGCPTCSGCENTPTMTTGTKSVCFGDSVTAANEGSNLNPSQGFCQLMSQEHGYTTILNKGLSGDWTTQALGRVQADVVSQNPDCTTVMFGINDNARAIPIATYKANLKSIVQQIKAGGSQVTLMTPNLVRSTPYANAFPPYLKSIREVSVEENVPLIDFYAWFGEQYWTASSGTWNGWYIDALHLSVSGNRMMADVCQQKQNQKACICRGIN
jgi:lysophospholipase L1-like esterase